MLLLLFTTSAVVLLDQFSKFYVHQSLSSGESIVLIKGILYITPVQNKGAAFGLLAGQQALFIIITLISIFLIAFYYFKAKEAYQIFNLALGLELGGAIGNLIDRLRLGGVTDFINFRIWPVFNIADAAIVLGVFFLILVSLRTLVSKQANSG